VLLKNLKKLNIYNIIILYFIFYIIMDNIIDLTIVTQKFNNQHYNFNFKGFIFEYNKKNYIITIHHNLPIHKITYKSIELFNVINSCWNEFLILECNFSNFIIHKKYNISLPKKNVLLYFNNIEIIVYDIKFIPFNNLNNYPYKLPYIECNIKNKSHNYNFKGLSGMPVYNDKKDKIIGIFSKYNIQDNTLYIIPIYILIKTLNKIDNNNIYTVNNYLVNQTIFHPNLKYILPINIYFLLEGDKNMIFYKKKNIYNYIIDNNPLLYNNNYIEYYQFSDNIVYKYNLRLLTLLNKILKQDELIDIFKQFQQWNCLII